jgi:tetratricopeptide (TPR) repeat protein
MTTTQPLLQQAIAAAKAGNRSAARDLLLQVVSDDERNEQAWLWLSGVVDDPAEQRIALENVLEINPRNASALKGMAWLDAHHPRPKPAPAEPPQAPEPPAAQAPPEPPARKLPPVVYSMLPEDSNACPFCGAATMPSQQSCAFCKRSLLVEGERAPGRSIWTTLLALIWGIFGVLSTISSVLLLVASRYLIDAIESGEGIPPESRAAIEQLSGAPLVGALLGGLLAVFMAWSLFRRQQIGYVTSILLLVLNVAFVVARSGAALICGAAFLLIMGALTALAYRDFFPPKARVRLDVPERKAEEHFNMGLAYKNRGMWYMAAREWEGAVKRRSNEADYHRALGLAYAQLKDYGRALRELQAAVDMRPADPLLKDDLATVEKMALQP